jgi:hypothetical protein
MVFVLAIILGGLLVGAAGFPLILTGLGFTTGGIVSGSIGAGMMSAAAIANGGGVVAGSLVAILQSIGAITVVAVKIGACIGLACTTAYAGMKALFS